MEGGREDKINNLMDNNSKDNKTFLSELKLLKVKNVIHTKYIKDEQGNKFYSDKEKYNLMEQTWKDMFRITEEEEVNFERAHSEHISNYVNINSERNSPYTTSTLNIPNRDNFHTTAIDKDEIIRHLKISKKKAPVASKKDKLIIEKCTDKTIDQLVNIYNACYSAGYFPSAFIQAIIKFIPEENITIKPLSYRPISLLDVPGKIFLAGNNIIESR